MLQGPPFHPDEDLPTQACQQQYWVQPQDIIQQLNSFWQPIWQRDPRTHQSDTSDLPESEEVQQLLSKLPPAEPIPVDMIDPAEWDAAVKHLRPGSARGIDMISASEMQLLPKSVIHQLAHVMANYPSGYPEWFMLGVTCPFSKVMTSPQASETRPITVLPQAYRLWASVAYRQIVRRLAKWVPSDVSGLLPKRGASQAAFKAQLAIEISKRQSQPLAGLVLDLTKCFNNIRWSFGLALLRAAGIPDTLLSQWSGSLSRLRRVWAVAKHVSDPIDVTTGYPEGDTWSVLVMIMLACSWACALRDAIPSLESHPPGLSAYADNWSWHTVHQNLHGTFMTTTLSVTRMAGVQLDPAKTWCWATKPGLAAQIQADLADLLAGQQIPILPAAKDLGFQMQYSGNAVLGSVRGERKANDS